MYAMALSPSFLAYALPGLSISISCVLALWLNCLRPRSALKVAWVATSSAIFGSISVLSFKGVATCVRLTLQGDDQMHQLGTWLLLLSAAICAPANVSLMNLTIEESNATHGMPLYQALLILATIVSGGLFYDEFSGWVAEVDVSDIIGFVAGVCTLVGGIVLVAYQPERAGGGDVASKPQPQSGATLV
jgi:hypothetical protein